MALPHRPDAPELPDFSMLKKLARDQLLYLLEQRPGKKDLFIEADLMSPLDRIANVSILKQHEVDKLYKVEHKPALSSSEQRVSGRLCLGSKLEEVPAHVPLISP
ncbi:vacuolar protein sorting-associated protein 33B-like [Hippopotamus amphibius kiboko]|uniref:vacuolar protein sorting-associated protein 33B-like n=1 Tax=Hippopotamus amphibius kiboko TaxID=575201 RepID=UPI00259A9A12|nr:vacuolar protein sorting-associated protein 33B-like [Hippopotamus amphibius kiboko]XP_057575985.1 vacuolar protein sorting-associated protein 33B-like [Hippopotamus amphibius kiboko]